MHVSAPAGGPAVAEHCVPVPSARQIVEPVRAHAPTPAMHTPPSPAKVSSVMPSQSSSVVLHVSATGPPATAEHSVTSPLAAQRRLP